MANSIMANRKPEKERRGNGTLQEMAQQQWHSTRGVMCEVNLLLHIILEYKCRVKQKKCHVTLLVRMTSRLDIHLLGNV